MSITPYLHLMRLHKPVGFILLFWPVCAAILLARPPLGTPLLWFIFTAGVLLTRSAGCIINDLWDQRIDRFVTRTAQRPLASGALSRQQAWCCLAFLLIGLLALFLQLNRMAQYYGLAAALLTILYPACKRFFPFPQLILGLTFNMGVLMVFAQTQMQVPASAIWLYAASVCWTFAYDTAYALSDKADDLKLGLHSSAITLGRAAIPVIILGTWLALAGYLMAMGASLKMMLVALALAAFLLCQLGLAQLHRDPFAFFSQQAVWGGLVVLSTFLQVW